MRNHRLVCFLTFLGIGFSSGQTSLSAEYPGDAGMAGNKDVLFLEDFEGGDLAAIGARYTERQNFEGMSLNADIPAGSSGKHSLEMTSILGQNEGGRLFRRINPGLVGKVHLRFYIKYFSGVQYHHTMAGLGGFNPPRDYFIGLAGLKPTGSSNFTILPEYATRFDLYTYWMHMRAWSNPPTTYYGNTFIQDPNLKPVLGQWLCVEIMVKMNDPLDSSNGELALWLDGKPIIHLGKGFPKGRWLADTWRPDSAGTPFEGFQWRNSDSLNINWLRIQHYVTDGAAGSVGRVRFDQVVLARRYIGPIVPISTGLGHAKPSRGAKPAVRKYYSNGRQAATPPGGKPPRADSERTGAPVFSVPAP